MFESEQDFRKIIEQLEVDTAPRPAHRQQLRQRFLEAARSQPKRRRVRRIVRKSYNTGSAIMRSKFAKLAAASIIIAGGVALVTIFNKGTTVAFADVREQILAIQTMSCHFVMESTPEGEAEYLSGDLLFREPGQMRMELTEPSGPELVGMVHVFDFKRGQVLMLIPKAQHAVRMDVGQLPQQETTKDFLAEIKTMMDGAEDCLGERQIDGVRAEGFLVRRAQVEMEIWVDSQTYLPVLMEIGAQGMSCTYTMTDFAFNEDLADSLFALDPPDGYALETVDFPLGDPSEEDLLVGLELVAKMHLDRFPGAMFPGPKVSRTFSRYIRTMRLDAEQIKERSNQFARLFVFLGVHSDFNAGTVSGYVGAGVELGDADSPVLWYRPKGQGRYRVVYGDLHVEEVDEADLPTAPTDQLRPAAAEPLQGDVIIEVEGESLALSGGCRAVQLDGASDGEAILLEQMDAQANGSVSLQSGFYYEVTVDILAPDKDHDAILVGINGQEPYRVFPRKWEKLTRTVPFYLTVSEDGRCSIAITPAETGIYVDKITFTRLDP